MEDSSSPERIPFVGPEAPTSLTDSADIRVADAEDQAGGLDLPTRSLEMDEWNRKILKLQRISLIVAHVFAILVVVLTSRWVSQLGGLSWQKGHAKLVFNWHPLLMILAFCFMTVSSLSFRYHHYQLMGVSRTTSKLLHGVGWAVAAVCMVVGVVAAFMSHNDRVSGFIANLYSLHSWVGIAVLLLYMIQFSVGVGAFAVPNYYSATSKAKILQVHAFFGPILYLSVMLTILLGIQEKEGFIGCGYKVKDEPDMVPFRHFSEIPAVCKQSHSVSSWRYSSFTMYSLYRNQSHEYGLTVETPCPSLVPFVRWDFAYWPWVFLPCSRCIKWNEPSIDSIEKSREKIQTDASLSRSILRQFLGASMEFHFSSIHFCTCLQQQLRVQ